MGNSTKVISTVFTILFFSICQSQNIEEHLKQLFGEKNVTAVDSSAFKEFYRVKVPQAINHDNASSQTFDQQVLIGYKAKNAVTVLQTEGYAIPEFQKDIKYKSELAEMLNANQVIVEHRFFGNSIPDSTSRKFLTYKHASEDYHVLKQKLQTIFTGKWVTTGVSKSGDAALAYRYFYPKDVSATVVFGICLTTSEEDLRFQNFIKQKRTTDEGQKINKAQIYLLQNKVNLMPVFKEILENEKQDLSKWDLETLYDYGVLDLEVSFWQYYKSYEDLRSDIIPMVDSEMKINQFKFATNLDKFEDKLVFYSAFMTLGGITKKMKSHYYQAFSQGGYYGYDETPFLKYLKLKDYPLKVFAGEPTTFDPSFRQGEKKWTETEMEHVIFINGENDPWSVAKINPSKDRDNIQIIAKDANHTLKLNGLPINDLAAVKTKLNDWIGTNLK